MVGAGGARVAWFFRARCLDFTSMHGWRSQLLCPVFNNLLKDFIQAAGQDRVRRSLIKSHDTRVWERIKRPPLLPWQTHDSFELGVALQVASLPCCQLLGHDSHDGKIPVGRVQIPKPSIVIKGASASNIFARDGGCAIML